MAIKKKVKYIHFRWGTYKIEGFALKFISNREVKEEEEKKNHRDNQIFIRFDGKGLTLMMSKCKQHINIER